MGYAFWRNFFIMSFILSPVFILFGMILFSGKPKEPTDREAPGSEGGEKEEGDARL